jgi:hypothetical protein
MAVVLFCRLNQTCATTVASRMAHSVEMNYINATILTTKCCTQRAHTNATPNCDDYDDGGIPIYKGKQRAVTIYPINNQHKHVAGPLADGVSNLIALSRRLLPWCAKFTATRPPSAPALTATARDTNTSPPRSRFNRSMVSRQQPERAQENTMAVPGRALLGTNENAMLLNVLHIPTIGNPSRPPMRLLILDVTHKFASNFERCANKAE